MEEEGNSSEYEYLLYILKKIFLPMNTAKISKSIQKSPICIPPNTPPKQHNINFLKNTPISKDYFSFVKDLTLKIFYR